MNTTKEDFKNNYDDNISVSSDEEIYDEDITYYNYVKEDDPEHEDFIFDEELLENIEWRMIKIGDNNLRISSSGKIQYMDISIFYITSGNRYPGTPYRYIDIKALPPFLSFGPVRPPRRASASVATADALAPASALRRPSAVPRCMYTYK